VIIGIDEIRVIITRVSQFSGASLNSDSNGPAMRGKISFRIIANKAGNNK
jgi:hypothetical protein